MVPTPAYKDLRDLYEELTKKRRAQVPNVTTALRTDPQDPGNEFGKLMSMQQQLDEVDRMMKSERAAWLVENLREVQGGVADTVEY
ncbi:hypothetical protein MKK68_02315 [Methylobacterium sp. E-016]|uniref:hypothetical protein n=1 Tax=Methylobacterium sp. E-016 TaxID=2836556 RepID=UPI001FBA3E79|nr:hypothetical protein [Methylobacterium sp. E-016]MCJ2074494.1 hypothetical protein [Methylobacterium sp. E-016]